MFRSEKIRGLDTISPCLPRTVSNAIGYIESLGKLGGLCEIRLRKGAYQSFTMTDCDLIISSDGKADKSVMSPLMLDGEALSDTVYRLCGGSVYSFSEQMKKGFITVGGVRIGICGAGIVKDGMPAGFSEYHSLNIRFPRHIKNAADELLRYIARRGVRGTGGILVISPPGGGKTTFLRSLAAALSRGFSDGGKITARRVCVIDERGELYIPEAFSGGFADVISYLPKDYCVELCTRVMTPDYVILDELGNDSEAESICGAATRGVVFAASCHGMNLDDVRLKSGIGLLLERGVFRTVCELHSVGEKRSCVIKSVGSCERGTNRC